MAGVGGDPISVVPADEAGWAAVAAVRESCADSRRCWCQRYKLARGESFAGQPVEERTHRMRTQTGDGSPGADDGTTGLVAFRGGEAVGWCGVEPRPAYGGLLRVGRVPWQGRSQDKGDPSVWAVTCFVTRPGHRRQGVASALAAASIEFARAGGAKALEGYPRTTATGLLGEMHPGTFAMFIRAGFVEVSRPTPRRAVVRHEM
ncbi:MAG: GNAT family N-acetyltransferase [Ornithinibacter sp.]